MIDKAIGAVTEAKNAETQWCSRCRAEEFPDLWVKRHHLQGHEEGVERQPAAGQLRHGQIGAHRVVTFRRQEAARDADQPENFDPSKKYPLMVYIYES